MKRILYTLLASVVVLAGNHLFSGSTLEANVETPAAGIGSIPSFSGPVATEDQESIVSPPVIEPRDPYGELYFTIITPREYLPPETPPPYVEAAYRLARLPGSCVVGLEACPEAETVQTPFDMQDVFSTDGTGLAWSPDGRYGLLVIHPEDELSAGKTQEELDQLRSQSPSEFDVSPSTLYMFDAETNTWSEVHRADGKFIYTPFWSSDGQQIAFQVRSSVWGFHASQADDGIYVIRPDGSDLRQVSRVDASILGWIGNSLLLREVKSLPPAYAYRMEMLALDGEIKPLFESARAAFYALAPDGGLLLASDLHDPANGTPAKSVDLLALDGSILNTFGTFTNYSASIYPLVWSRDGSMAAFANLRRVYVGPRDGQGNGFPNGLLGIPPDGPVREVYVADDSSVEPSFWNLQFSHDNRYLLMDVYDGTPHFVAVALDTGQAIPLEIKGMTESEQASSFSWRP
jgi:hypothetical protein